MEPCEAPLDVKAMPFNTWQFVKRKMKEQCRGFRDTPDHHIRLLYKGMELKNDGMVEEYEMAGGRVHSTRSLLPDSGKKKLGA